MGKNYTYEDLKEKLTAKGIEHRSRSKQTSASASKERNERIIDDICVINVPPRNAWFQIHSSEKLFNIIKNDPSFNIQLEDPFPKAKFKDVNVDNLPDNLEKEIERLNTIKSYKTYDATTIDFFTKNQMVICFENGASERKNLNPKYPHLILFFNDSVLDQVIDIIANLK